MLQVALEPEIEAHLAADAERRGLSVEQFVKQVMTQYVLDEEDLSAGLADINAGHTRAARDVFAELHERYGIRG